MFTAKVRHKDVLGTDDKTSYFDYVQVVRTLAESFSRGLVSTVVFSAIFVTMVFAEWRVAGNLTPTVRAEHDAEMRACRATSTARARRAARAG